MANKILSLQECQRQFDACVQQLALLNLYGYCMIHDSVVNFNDRIPTAMVNMPILKNKDGTFTEILKPEFTFSRAFWSKLTPDERLFLVMHEIRHVESRHGKRGMELLPAEPTPLELRTYQVAADHAVNGGLLNDYDFDVKNLPHLRKHGVWPDLHEPPLDPYLSMEEYYYYLLAKYRKEDDEQMGGGKGTGKKGDESSREGSGSGDGKGEGFDKHLTPQQSRELEEAISDALQEIAERAIDDLSADQLKELGDQRGFSGETPAELLQKSLVNEVIQKGRSATGSSSVGEVVKAIRKSKRPWRQFAREFVKQVMKDHYMDAWVPERRTMLSLPSDLRLPAEHLREDKQLIDVLLFLDTSSSCSNLVPHFQGLLEAMPTDIFKLRVYGFTTAVYPVDRKNPRFLTGGTRFDPIADEVDKFPGRRYVFVFTDGDGNDVEQDVPERWHWFGYNINKRFIDPRAHVHDLSHFK
jgi:predicted metal-dependent peptidase